VSSFRQKQQDRLNTFPQYIASLKTHDDIPMDIHFAAIYSSKPDATAVVFSHGWPGSWIEFVPMMEMLMGKYTPETLP
jgi:microsomal epoxide hydrolase